MAKQLGKAYEPLTFEQDRYAEWEKEGCFATTDVNAAGQESYCIVIPPPNVTGALHMGHALSYSIQDFLVRWQRMEGKNALWLPGTDHAGIATQTQVEKKIAKEGKGPTGRPLTRHDLGREEFLKRVWQWKDDHGSQITNQMRRLGFSLDWKRERFTLDEGLNRAVRDVFVSLYKDGLIYRGERIINWCPRCQTALSDLEVLPTDRKGNFWHIRYDIEGGGSLTIATTRPETLLGDTAVCVHPEDERYQHLRGKKATLPILGRKIPVIFDEYVDREFGSGALKVTPAHDFNDYDLGKKHNLEMISVMGKDGRMTAEAGPYAGLKFSEAREKVVEALKESGQLLKIEDHAHKVGLCQRCDTVAEPIISKQWFVKIEPLAKPAIDAVESGKIEFVPKMWEKTYFEWMHNIRDWCISRQLWWGHQIPAWHCGKCEGITVSQEAPKSCSSCGGSALTQDPDVLDTWFSSALWPFSTLGWPENTQALKTFYPTSVMVTGSDIIFFWVARMIMMGLHFMKGAVPFHKVYLHAMVRDEKGDKMSKTKGNVIDPLDVVSKHGADALRFTLAAFAGQGRDIKLSVDRVEGYRAFGNKLWNAVKYFHLQLEQSGGFTPSKEVTAQGLSNWIATHASTFTTPNQWVLSRLQTAIDKVRTTLGAYEFDQSAQAIYQFAWMELCDWYIEFSKPEGFTEKNRAESLIVLHEVLETLLRLIHPFMPHLSEELWQSLPWTAPVAGKPRTIMLQKYPHATPSLLKPAIEKTVSGMQAFIEAIRNFRGENNLSPKVEFPVTFRAHNTDAAKFIESQEPLLKKLSRISALNVATGAGGEFESVIPLSYPAVELRISLQGLVNVEEEMKRLNKEMEKVDSDIAHIERKLSQETFIAKAPKELVEKERNSLAGFQAKKKEFSDAIARLSKFKS